MPPSVPARKASGVRKANHDALALEATLKDVATAAPEPSVDGSRAMTFAASLASGAVLTAKSPN